MEASPSPSPSPVTGQERCSQQRPVIRPATQLKGMLVATTLRTFLQGKKEKSQGGWSSVPYSYSSSRCATLSPGYEERLTVSPSHAPVLAWSTLGWGGCPAFGSSIHGEAVTN